MNKTKPIFGFLIANLFLYVLLFQPIHQLEHFAHHLEFQQKFQHDFHCEHFAHISTENHCELCEFMLAPTLEYQGEELEIPVVFKTNSLSKNDEFKTFFTEELILNNLLRGPPIA